MSDQDVKPLDEKDKVDAYLRLYDRQMTHYESTQGIEWKISVSIWALLATAIVLAAQRTAPPIGPALAPAVFLLPLIHAAWLLLIQGSERHDKKLWMRYRAAALSLVLSPAPLPSNEAERDTSPFRKIVWFVLEAGVTCVMAAILGCRIWA
jgi:hypothetical protein